MSLGEVVTKRIDELMYERGWSLYKVAKESCIPLSTLKNLYTKHTKCPTLVLIYKLADAFNMTPIEFIDCKLLDKNNVDYL